MEEHSSQQRGLSKSTEWESSGFRMANTQNKQSNGSMAEGTGRVCSREASNAVLRSLGIPCSSSTGCVSCVF